MEPFGKPLRDWNDQGSLVGLRKQDYKSLCAAVTTRATLVKFRQTDRQIAFEQDI